jgi:hypothetical protein
MSAWIVTKAHIDVLVQAMVVEGIVPMDQATETGKTLWRENHRSVNYRYSERSRTPAYTFTGIEAPLDAAVVFKAAACYEYQTCEHPGFKRSEARRLVDQLSDRMAEQLGTDRENAYDLPSWKAAPWGIDHRLQAVAALQ